VTQLVGLRLLIGAGFGASIANAVALASEFATPLWRSRVAATVYAMAAVGGAVGSFIAPMIIEPFGWHGIYAIGGGIPLFLVPVQFFGLAESRRFLMLRNASPKKLSPAVAGPTKGALDGLRRLLLSPYRAATILIWILSFLGISAVYLISSWLPTLMSLAGWSVSNSARAASAYSFGGIIGGVLLGWLVDKGHIKLSLLIAFGAAALALAALSFVPPLVPIWMVLIAVMGGGTIAVSYVLAAIAAVVYPTSMRASGIGAFGAIGRVGATVAPLVGGWLLANGFSALQILTSLVVPMTIGFVIMMLFSKHLEPDPATGGDA
jgi:AAHS family 4-hydroxybenzoate transporter-like MFS transporter